MFGFQSDLNDYANLHSSENSNAYRTVINEKDIKFDVCEALKSIPDVFPPDYITKMSLTFFSCLINYVLEIMNS